MLEPAEIRQNTNSDLGEGSPDRRALAPEKYIVSYTKTPPYNIRNARLCAHFKTVSLLVVLTLFTKLFVYSG